MKYILLFMSLLLVGQQQDDGRTKYFPKVVEEVSNMPAKNKVWVFILAGQSNMAGRGQVEPEDTVPNERILSVDAKGNIVIAKEPLHFYEPTRTGLDCGLSFGRTIIKQIPDRISVLILPVAIGGSSIQQWLGDSTYRGVRLMSNFREKLEIGQRLGEIKAILWHQGESDANAKKLPLYKEKLARLIREFRTCAKNENLPVLIGELGSYSKDNEYWQKINQIIRDYSAHDRNTAVIPTSDLKDKGDTVHFNSVGQRIMGQRFAIEYLKLK